jgi:hypothetical protein
LALQHFQPKKNRSNKIQSAQFTDLKKITIALSGAWFYSIREIDWQTTCG